MQQKTKRYFIHARAVVERGASIGDNTNVWAFAHILSGSKVGKRCNIGDYCYIERGAIIGDNVTVKNGVMVWEGVTIKNGAFIGQQVVFTNDLYPRSSRLVLPGVKDRYREKNKWLKKTIIGRGASLGAHSIILAGCHIGSFAMVAAGSVVTKPAAPHALMRGNPARHVGWVCECGAPFKDLSLKKLRIGTRCSSCEILYG